MDPEADHQRKTAALAKAVDQARARGERIGLRKSTSNLFRHRSPAGKYLIDVRGFKHCLNVDPQRMTADVEGMITYEALVDETLEEKVGRSTLANMISAAVNLPSWKAPS